MGAAGHLLFHPAFLKGAYTMGKITQDHFDLYINGKWVPAKDGATFQTRCPANGELLADCAQATREDVDEAVSAAWDAFQSWRNVTTNERAAILNRIADVIEANAGQAHP